ncbi:phage tail tape measure protein [Vagococcus entomophilus]|uniref:Phage tail tape measure protein n=1 Tax=Vagococcus entomophilus TaxID=1160095 RepID=A0A430AK51_9ENTE|nr:phage tail tape measure protein [Vagococcus entomophilus]RSU08429.1 phage tail tape measure protein [Vagococcus entomophilus]
MANKQPLGNMIIELGLDSSAFSKGLEGAKKAITSNMNAMKAQMSVIGASGDKLGVLQAKYSGLQKTLDATRNQIDKLRDAYKDSLDENGNATKQSAKYADELNKAIARAGSLEKQIKQTDDAMSNMKKQMAIDNSPFTKLSEGLDKIKDKIKSVSTSIKDIGKGATTKVSLPIVASLGVAYNNAANFSGQLQTIRALINDGSVSQGKLTKQIEELGDKSVEWSSKYGISTDSINEGMEEIIKKGYTYEQTLGAMPSILDATVASGDDFATVMSASTSILEQFGLKAESTTATLKNTQRVTDSLTYVANLTSTGFEDLGKAMEYVGPVANSLGMSVEETASAIGLLSNNGIEADKAGTALRGALSKLLKPSDANAAAMAAMGVNFEAFQKGAIGFPEILSQIEKGTQGWNGATRAQYLALAFGTEAQTGMNILVNQGADALTNLTGETEKASGYTQKLANQMNNTDKNQLNKFKESIKNLSTVFGEQLLPVFTPIIEKVTTLVKSFIQLSDKTKKTILTVAGLTAVIGPLLMVVGSVGQGFSVAIAALAKLSGGFGILSGVIAQAGGLLPWIAGLFSTLFSPITLVVGAIAGLGIAFVALNSKGKSFGDVMSSIWGNIKSGITWIGKLFVAIKDLFSFDSTSNIKGLDILNTMFSNETVTKILTTVQSIRDALVSAFSEISSFFMSKASGIMDFWNRYSPQIIQALQNFWNIIKPIFSVALTAILFIVETVWDNIKGVIAGAIKIIEGIVLVFTGILTLNFSTLWEGIKNIFFGAIQLIWNYINIMFIGKILGGIGSLVSGASGLISGMWTGIKTFFSEGITGVIGSVTGWVSKILEFFSNFKANSLSAFSSMWSGIKGFFVNGVKDIVDKVVAVPGKMKDGILRGGGALKDAFVSIWKGAVNGIALPVNKIIGGANWILEKFGSKSKIDDWKPYAKGTEGHPGGNALVNDGRGAEIVQTPDGQAFIPKGKNVFIPNMPKGTRVYNAEQTANIMGRKGPTFRYKNGNVGDWFSGIWNGTKNVGKKIVSGIGDVFDYISNPSKLLEKVVSKFVDYDGVGGVALDMAKGMIGKVKGSMVGWIKKLFDEESPKVKYNPSAGVEQWRGLATKALKMEQQYSAGNLKALLYQMQTESGGNPNAVNNWDINAKNGIPSKGLLQVIEPTFRAYARPGYDKSLTDPLSNILASIRYAVSRYGSLTNAYRGVGYENGGIITKQHLAMVGEGNKPEMVIPLTNKARSLDLMAQAIQMMGISGGTVSAKSNDSDSRWDDVIMLLTKLLQKDSNLYVDSKEVGSLTSNSVTKAQNDRTKIQNLLRGIKN